MKIEVNLKDLIETIVDMTVEHYVDEYETSDRQTHKKIDDDNIESMKKTLITKIVSIIGKEKTKSYDEDKAYSKKAEDCTVKELAEFLKKNHEFNAFTHIIVLQDDVRFMSIDSEVFHLRLYDNILLNAK